MVSRSPVVHVFEGKAPGRCSVDRRAGSGVVQKVKKPLWIVLFPTDLEEGADESSNLVSKKTLADEIEAKTPGITVHPGGVQMADGTRGFGIGYGERSPVMFAGEAPGASFDMVHVDWFLNPGCALFQPWRPNGGGAPSGPVGITFPASAEACVERLRNNLGVDDADLLWQQTVETLDETGRWNGMWEVDVSDLGRGMNAGVGPSGAGSRHTRFPGQLSEG